MNKWKKFTAACMGAAMVGTTAFGSSTVFADDTVTLDVWHQFTDPESAQTSAFEAAVKEYEKEHDNIKIKLHGLDTESYKTKISTGVRKQCFRCRCILLLGTGKTEIVYRCR